MILPAYTCPLVPIAVHSLGLRVQLCDTRRGHFDFDPAQLSRLADARTLAILPTHLGGRIADVERACDIARGAGAWVIEDAAQALGAGGQQQCRPAWRHRILQPRCREGTEPARRRPAGQPR